jgi:hypothetical protein
MDELTKIALVGTSRHGGDVTAEDHPTCALLTGVAGNAAVSGNDREELLLMRSGARAIYDMAGRKPITEVVAVEPAPREVCRTVSRKLAGLLQNALVTNASDLLVDFLRQMQGSRIVAPPDLLPLLLDCADPAVREQLLPILGERGKWLSRLNAEWSWVHQGVSHLTDTDQAALQKIWEEGTIVERCQVVAILRRSNPQQARDWVGLIFSQEKPAHRASLLEEFTTGLSPADEPFLESSLADRAPSVGQVAARMLCRLPNSALAARMRERASAMLSAGTKGFLRKKTRLACAPPEKIDRDWERDGIPSKAPTGRGLRAFWAETVLSAVPPAHWCAQFDAPPAALIAAILDDQFEEAVLLGWTEAATRFAGNDPGSAAWLTPLWEHWAGAAERMNGSGRAGALERMKSLLPCLSRDDAERGMLSLFTAAAGSDNVESLGLMTLLTRPWSATFSEKLLALVRRVLAKQSDNTAYQWAGTLFTAARAIPAEAFLAAQAGWEAAPAQKSSAWHVDAIQREIDKFVETIATRQSFIMEVEAQP